MELSKIVSVAIVTTSSWQQNFYKFCFPRYIHQPNFSFMSLMILELFRIMLSKCRHYTPESRFQTGNKKASVKTTGRSENKNMT